MLENNSIKSSGVIGTGLVSSTLNGPSSGVMTPRPSEIQVESQILQVKLDVLDQIIITLHQRLKAILRDEPQPDTAKKDDSSMQTSLGKMVREQRKRVEGQIEAVAFIIKTLEI